jgi:HAMP domain-containing protein
MACSTTGAKHGKILPMKKRSSLERKMLSYFGLIAAASLLITIEFLWAIRVITPQSELIDQSTLLSLQALQTITRGLESLQNKALLMFAVQAVVTLIVLIMFMKRITGPLQRMVEETRAISEGDLSRIIRIDRKDEIGLLGETINGLTSDIQEVVALGLSTESDALVLLDELQTCDRGDPVCRQRLNEVRNILTGFRDILDGFRLLPAPLAASKSEKTK